jgi:hypothetical protein
MANKFRDLSIMLAFPFFFLMIVVFLASYITNNLWYALLGFMLGIYVIVRLATS